MTTRGTCLWSRYPVLVIIHELEALNFKALCCQLMTIGDSGYQQHGMHILSQRTSSTRTHYSLSDRAHGLFNDDTLMIMQTLL